MNLENRIKIIDTVSDVFLELDRFRLELCADDDYSFFIDIDKKYDDVIKIIRHKYFEKKIKFRLKSIEDVKNWNNRRQQRNLINDVDTIFKKLDSFEKRIKVLLPEYEFSYKKHNFVCIAFMNGGLFILPFYESDKDSINPENRKIMNGFGYDFSSYEKNRDEIVNDQNVKISHIHVYFTISEPSEPILKKIKRFKFF